MVPVSSTSAKVNLYAPEGFVVFKRSRVEFQSLASQVSSMRAGCFERGAWVSSKTLCTARTTQRGQGGCRGTRQRPKLGQLFWPCQRKLHPDLRTTSHMGPALHLGQKLAATDGNCKMSTARFQFAASRTHKWFSRICCQFESIEHLSLGCASSGCRGLASSFDAFAMRSQKRSPCITGLR